MITEEQMKTLFAHANPIPEPEDVELGEVRGTAYLATLQQRSSEMTQLDTRPVKQADPKRPVMAWAAAAIAVVVIGALLIFMSPSGDDPVATTVPTPTTVADGFENPVPPTVEGLAGIWHSDGKQILIRLSIDGTYALDDRGSLDTDPRDIGTYQVDGTTITFLSSGEGSFCAAGNVAVWEDVGFTHTDRLKGTVAADDCFVGSVGVDFTSTLVSRGR